VEKAKVIRLFRNGDRKHNPVKIALNLKRFPTMEHLLKHATQEVKLVTGSCRKICDLQGNVIRRVADFFDGQEYVACGGEAFKPTTYDYSQVTETTEETGESTEVTEVTEEVPTEEYTEPTTEEVVTETTEVVNEETPVEETTEQTTEQTTEETTDTTGGSPSLKAEQDVPRYASPTVARMGKLLASPPKAKLAPAQPVVKHYLEKRSKEEKLEKFGVQVAKAKVIFVFRNADKRHGGERIAVNLKRYPTLKDLYRHLDSQVKLFTGSVRKICDNTGKLVTDLAQLKDGGSYVACGGEPFYPLPYQRQT